MMLAPSAADGLQILATNDFRGVISDFRTPGGITGADVHDWLKRHRPEIATRMIFITGDTASSETVAFSRKPAFPALRNPFASIS